MCGRLKNMKCKDCSKEKMCKACLERQLRIDPEFREERKASVVPDSSMRKG